MLATRSLKSGADYDALKNAVVIMILPFDPFGLNRMAYTIKTGCVEVPEMEYEDGASTIYLYTKGTKGIPSEAVRQLLRYMGDSTYQNAVNEDLREIHRMVETVRKEQKVVKMRIKMVDDLIRQAKEMAKLENENTKQTAEISKLEDKNAKQTAEITKLENELHRLREELNRRNGWDGNACPIGHGVIMLPQHFLKAMPFAKGNARGNTSFSILYWIPEGLRLPDNYSAPRIAEHARGFFIYKKMEHSYIEPWRLAIL